MSGGLCRELRAGGLCKCMEEIGYVSYDKAQIRNRPMVLLYRDDGFEFR